MRALATLSLFLVISSGLSLPEKGIPSVKPEYLDSLLETGQYELFAEIMNIPDAKLVIPNEDQRNENEIPMFNKDLLFGDIMPNYGGLKEETRQALRFDKWGGNRWPNRRIPYYIANHYSAEERNVIQGAINNWNDRVRCPKLTQYNGENDYVYVINGNGCWSYIGKIGGQQSLSLQRNGCVWTGTVQHEFEHAAGITHEHNRLDRDNYVDILWDNIPEDWRGQYQKTDPDNWKDIRGYDYYSVMHYGMTAPGTNKDAFRIKSNGIDRNRVGRGRSDNTLTWTDVCKLNDLYEC